MPGDSSISLSLHLPCGGVGLCLESCLQEEWHLRLTAMTHSTLPHWYCLNAKVWAIIAITLSSPSVTPQCTYSDIHCTHSDNHCRHSQALTVHILGCSSYLVKQSSCMRLDGHHTHGPTPTTHTVRCPPCIHLDSCHAQTQMFITHTQISIAHTWTVIVHTQTVITHTVGHPPHVCLDGHHAHTQTFIAHSQTVIMHMVQHPPCVRLDSHHAYTQTFIAHAWMAIVHTQMSIAHAQTVITHAVRFSLCMYSDIHHAHTQTFWLELPYNVNVLCEIKTFFRTTARIGSRSQILSNSLWICCSWATSPLILNQSGTLSKTSGPMAQTISKYAFLQ